MRMDGRATGCGSYGDSGAYDGCGLAAWANPLSPRRLGSSYAHTPLARGRLTPMGRQALEGTHLPAKATMPSKTIQPPPGGLRKLMRWMRAGASEVAIPMSGRLGRDQPASSATGGCDGGALAGGMAWARVDGSGRAGPVGRPRRGWPGVAGGLREKENC